MWPGLSRATLPFTLNFALCQATRVAAWEEDEEKAKEAILPISCENALPFLIFTTIL